MHYGNEKLECKNYQQYKNLDWHFDFQKIKNLKFLFVICSNNLNYQ